MPVSNRRWPRALPRAAWWATVPLAGAAVARLARFDRHPALSMANAGTHIVYLPAWGALAVGIKARRPGLTAVAGAVAAAHAVWTAPELRRRRLAPDALEGSARFRFVTANVRCHSPDSTPLGEELVTLAADVLLLQELTGERLAEIKATGVFDRFPYSHVDARPGSFGGGIWSRYPLADEETWDCDGAPMTRATVDVDGTKVRVFNVHCKAPTRRRWIGIWKSHLDVLRREFEAAFAAGPVILAGDFNSTWGHQPFRELLAAGLRDSHVDVGRGLAPTWPRLPLLPGLFRIDHVLLSEGVEAVAVREGVGRSSDHRPVVADLALPRARRPAPLG